MYVIAFFFMENLLPALCALFKAVPSAGAESQEEPDPPGTHWKPLLERGKWRFHPWVQLITKILTF